MNVLSEKNRFVEVEQDSSKLTPKIKQDSEVNQHVLIDFDCVPYLICSPLIALALCHMFPIDDINISLQT